MTDQQPTSARTRRLLGPGTAVITTLAIVTAVAWLAHGARARVGDATARVDAVLELDPTLVNLYEPGGHRLLRASLAFELAASERTHSLREDRLLMARLQDMVVLTLSSRSFDQIQGPEGKVALRAELVDRANTILGAGSVRSVYFQEFVVR